MNLLAKIREKIPFLAPHAKQPEQPQDDPALMKSILQTEQKPDKQSILEAAPEIDEELLEEIEPPKSLLLYALKGFFVFLIGISFASLLFFTSQLSSTLNFATNVLSIPSVLKDLNSGNEEVKSAQTDLNLYRYLQARLYLESFAYRGDEYVKNYYIASNNTSSKEEISQAQAKMKTLRVEISDLFKKTQAKLSEKTWLTLIETVDRTDDELKTMFFSLLRDKLSTVLPDAPDFRLFRQTMKTVDNVELQALISNADIDALNDEEFAKFVLNLNNLTLEELVAIQKIKDSRINWSDVINRIEVETSYVDQYFSGGYFDEVGGIQYTSYDFDTVTGKITITGITKRYDTNNFTMISNLIDRLDSSPSFQKVEMKSFTKSGNADEGYTAVLRLGLELQKDPLGETSIDSIPEFLNNEAGVPINK